MTRTTDGNERGARFISSQCTGSGSYYDGRDIGKRHGDDGASGTGRARSTRFFWPTRLVERQPFWRRAFVIKTSETSVRKKLTRLVNVSFEKFFAIFFGRLKKPPRRSRYKYVRFFAVLHYHSFSRALLSAVVRESTFIRSYRRRTPGIIYAPHTIHVLYTMYVYAYIVMSCRRVARERKDAKIWKCHIFSCRQLLFSRQYVARKYL